MNMMTFVKRLFPAILALLLVFTFTSCNPDEEEENNNSSLNGSSQPANNTAETVSGDYDFNGTTWTYTFSSETTTYSFTENTVTMTDVFGTTTTTKEYSYTQDKANALLKLKLTKVTLTENGSTFSYTSATEQEAHYTSTGTSYGTALTYACTAAEFAEEKVFKYSVSESTLTLTKYFNKTLPSEISFDATNGGYSNYLFVFRSAELIYQFSPTFSGNSFSGNMYLLATTGMTLLGNVEGSYTASEAGTKNCSITITFTSLPDGVTSLTTGTAYTLSSGSWEDSDEYTLKQ